DQLVTLAALQTKLEGIRVDDAILRGALQETTGVRKLTLAGSLLALVGLVIAGLSPILWLDITGGIFLGTGIFLVAVGLLWRRSSVLNDFKQRLVVLRQEVVYSLFLHF